MNKKEKDIIECANEKLKARPIRGKVAKIKGLKAIPKDKNFYVIGFYYPKIDELSRDLKKEVGATVLDVAQECSNDLGYDLNFTLKPN